MSELGPIFYKLKGAICLFQSAAIAQGRGNFPIMPPFLMPCKDSDKCQDLGLPNFPNCKEVNVVCL